ncbi:MAG TPA: molybdenum cofactor guanylyltransferase [Gammaproteobacteria bacterium]
MAGTVVGIVLAGGRSVRFGGEKAVAQLDDRPLLAWAAQRLRTVCANVAINVRPGTEAEAVARALGFPTLNDDAGDALGPLAGVKVGLVWAEGQGAQMLAVSPCDAPLLPDDLYVRLLECADSGAVMAETRDGRQPLCALWPVAALPAVRDALAGGAHPPTWQLLERLGARKVFFEPPESFANVNTPDELAAVQARRARM